MDGSWSKEAGESRGMPCEYIGICTKVQGNAWECNKSERIQSARGMHGNAGESQENVRVCPKCQGNARECQGNVRDWVQLRDECCKMQSNAGECQGNIWEWVQSATKMHGKAWEYRGMQD